MKPAVNMMTIKTVIEDAENECNVEDLECWGGDEATSYVESEDDCEDWGNESERQYKLIDLVTL